MTYPRLIGLSGVARSGKDTVAGILRDLYGYTPVSFSDALNKALIALNPLVPVSYDMRSQGTGRAVRVSDHERYADLIERVGYESAKENPEVRALLQRMGTEVGRNMLGDHVWIDALFTDLPKGQVVITNVRFPNEFAKVKAHRGEVWRVTRPGYTPAQGHVSDTALDHYVFDHYIENAGSLRDLADKVLWLLDPVQAVFS